MAAKPVESFAPGIRCDAHLSSLRAHRISDTKCERADFLWNSLASIAAISSFAPHEVVADDAVDDLAMPTEEEQKAADEAAMAERLRKKAELKKQASKPMGYQESMAAEKRKQESLKKTKEERRIALCEELGRGC
mmetsp:Transcript_30605/g.63119  ORF Transcript_30605/g.63119 Transcript_30605/m.63119 type:complete len:135 (+) Transcript_30605:37-441(+)